MMPRITYTKQATRQLRKLPQDVREQIDAKLKRYAETGAGDVKALVGMEGLRMRVGDYRVVFSEAKDEILVQAVANRRDVYR